MGWTNLLGIYPNAIENIFDACADAIEDVKEFARKLGYDDDMLRLNFDIEDEVLANLRDTIDVHDITNSLIGECLYLTKNVLEGTQFCKDFEITFDTYTNAEDSHLYVEHDGVTEEYHETGDMKELLEGILAEHLSDIIYNCLLNNEECSDEEITDDWIEGLKARIAEDLPYFDDADIVACYGNWKIITGTIRETVDDFLSAQREAERKPAIERD